MPDTGLVFDNCFILCHTSTSPHLLWQFLYVLGTSGQIILKTLIHPSSIKSLDALQGSTGKSVIYFQVLIYPKLNRIFHFQSIFCCTSSMLHNRSTSCVSFNLAGAFFGSFFHQYHLHLVIYCVGTSGTITCSLPDGTKAALARWKFQNYLSGRPQHVYP